MSKKATKKAKTKKSPAVTPTKVERIKTPPTPTLGAEELIEKTKTPKTKETKKSEKTKTPKTKETKKSEKTKTPKTKETKKSRKDAWGFIKGKKNSVIIRTLNDAGDKGVTIDEVAQKLTKVFPGYDLKKAKALAKQTLGDFQLDEGTWCASRGVKLTQKGDRLILPKSQRRVYKDE